MHKVVSDRRLCGWMGRICRLVTLVAVLAATDRLKADADPISPGSWTMVILPDTQHYVEFPEYYRHFTAQTQWIKDHATSHNIAFVLQEGDIVEDNNAFPSDPPNQWVNARAAMDILNDTNASLAIPYAIAPGNHDFGPSGNGGTRESQFSDADKFGPGTPYAEQPTVGSFFETNKTENSYHMFSAGGQDWLVLALEFGPRDEVVAWANQVAEDHPNHELILVTHAYLYSDDTRLDWATHGEGTSQGNKNPHRYGVADLPGGVNDGQELWDELVKSHENFRFVFSGHVGNDGTGHLSSLGDNGNVVEQILANYQFLSEGGQGYMRLLEFKTDGSIEVRTYSPSLDRHNRAVDQEFTLTTLNGVEGDLDQNGTLGMEDFQLFLEGWLSETSALSIVDKYRKGDLNLDGITDLHDAVLMDGAMRAKGLSFSFALLNAVPEPGSSALGTLGVAGLCVALGRPCSRWKSENHLC